MMNQKRSSQNNNGGPKEELTDEAYRQAYNSKSTQTNYKTLVTMKLVASFLLFLPSVMADLSTVVRVGDRPYFLLDVMKPSFLKDMLSK